MASRCERLVIELAREAVKKIGRGFTGPAKVTCPVCCGDGYFKGKALEGEHVSVECECPQDQGSDCPFCHGNKRYTAELVEDTAVEVECACDNGLVDVEVAPGDVDVDIGTSELSLALVQLDLEMAQGDAMASLLLENKDRIVAAVLDEAALHAAGAALMGLPAKRFAEDMPKRRVRRVAR